MRAEGRRSPDELARLKREALEDFDGNDDVTGDESSHKRRRAWKEESRRQDRQSKKQRQRNPEWND
ncbi:MAG: hypothetical protein KF886_04020 [Candidatus Hydrogenedentes bacterium]|nr:hypothetical protein [Candidatus Hydrogenedentota bacterium]